MTGASLETLQTRLKQRAAYARTKAELDSHAASIRGNRPPLDILQTATPPRIAAQAVYGR